MSYSGCHILLEFRQNRDFQCSQTCYKTSWEADIPLFNRFNNSLKVDKNRERTVGDGHDANTHVHKIKPGLKLEAESADMEQQRGGGGRHQSQQEAICNRMSALVNLEAHTHTHTHTQTNTPLAERVHVWQQCQPRALH